MTTIVDSSVLIDVLRGRADAAVALDQARRQGDLVSLVTARAEVLSGMRADEARLTMGLLEHVRWEPVTVELADRAAGHARTYRRSHPGIDLADYLLAAAAELFEAHLLTRNVRHFPMFESLTAPY